MNEMSWGRVKYHKDENLIFMEYAGIFAVKNGMTLLGEKHEK